MPYSTIQPPFTLRFHEMPRKELEEYGRWFHEVRPQRIAELAKAVSATPGFQNWVPDRTPESLDVLGKWFEGQVETRRQTDEELEEIRSSLVFPIDVPEEELTNRSFSLAMDIGMYFAEVILRNLPGTEWEQALKNRKFADYGQPVLRGFGKVLLNPVSIGVTSAYGISRQKPPRLRQVYETWEKMRTEKSK